jgi:hypothetical protein
MEINRSGTSLACLPNTTPGPVVQSESDNTSSVPNSIPVFFNTPRLVILYRFFSTGAVSNIFIKIRPCIYIAL